MSELPEPDTTFSRFSFIVELNSRPGKSGLYKVMIRIHRKGELPGRVMTDVEVPLKNWNPAKPHGRWVRTANPLHATLNAEIEKALNTVRRRVKSLVEGRPELTPKALADAVKGGADSPLFFEQAEKVLSGYRGEHSPYTTQNRRIALNSLKNFAGENLTVAGITLTMLRQYQQWLLKEGRSMKRRNSTDAEPKGLSATSVNTYLMNLKNVYEDMLRADGLTKRQIAQRSPFGDIEPLPETKAPKARLREKTVEDLAKKTPDLMRPHQRAKNKLTPNWSAWARWCWLMCYYLVGMRIGDLIRMRYEWFDVDAAGQPLRLHYQMSKNGRVISVPLSDQARQLLAQVWVAGAQPETYVLPFLKATAPYAKFRTRDQFRNMPPEVEKRLLTDIRAVVTKLSREAKKLAEDEGLQVRGKLTMHTARHSVGDAMRRKSREDKNFGGTDARDLLGHSSIRITEGYWDDLDLEGTDQAAASLYEK